MDKSIALNDEQARDAGIACREKLSLKQKAITRARAIWQFIKVLFVMSLLGMSGALAYKVNDLPRKYQVDNRPCHFVDEAKGIELTGNRAYSYYQRELFGIQFRTKDEVQAKTTLEVTGNEMMVLGTGPDIWWAKHIPMGSVGKFEPLAEAETYTFVIGKKAVAVDSKAFCR